MGNVLLSVLISITWKNTADAEHATAPAPLAGVPPCPSAAIVLLDCISTKASVWSPVGRVCTLTSTPVTIVILPAVHVRALWPQTVSSAVNRKRCCIHSPATVYMVSVHLDVPHTAFWTTSSPAESAILPAGTA